MHHLVLLALVACKPTAPNAAEPSVEPEPAPAAPVPAPAAEPAPATELPAPATGPGTQGTPCAEGGVCTGPPEGLACVEYFGIAGPRGPKFTSCEIRCTPAGTECPTGQTCTTVADGPGSVCRPKP